MNGHFSLSYCVSGSQLALCGPVSHLWYIIMYLSSPINTLSHFSLHCHILILICNGVDFKILAKAKTPDCIQPHDSLYFSLLDFACCLLSSLSASLPHQIPHVCPTFDVLVEVLVFLLQVPDEESSFTWNTVAS